MGVFIPTLQQALFFELKDVSKIADTTPSPRTLDRYIQSLSITEATITVQALWRARAISLQTDKAPDGSNVCILRYFDPLDTSDSERGSVREFCFALQKSKKQQTNMQKP